MEVEHIVVHTGQHYDFSMSEAFFVGLNIPTPDVNLGVGSGSHASQTGQLLVPLSETFEKYSPDWIFLYGDTNSTLAAAITASKEHFNIAHIEAGLRSFDKSMPEEINRICTDHLSDINFAPTISAMGNLKNEGLSDRSILVGDVMKDALTSTNFTGTSAKGNYLVLTLHRPSNVDDPERLKDIFEKLGATGERIILPVHPRLKNQLLKISNFFLPSNIELIEPLPYVEMIEFVKSSLGVITDSGGLQKETYMLGKLCLTVRTTTEWVETLIDGRNQLDPKLEKLSLFLENCYNARLSGDFLDSNTYGLGNASELILSNILER